MNEIQYINFNTIFHPWTASYFVDAFNRIHDSEQLIVPIRINSPGGYVVALEEMLDVVDTSEKPVAIFATGWCCSCGAALAMSGTDGLRFIAPNCEFMIHQVAGMAWGKAADIEADSNLINKMLERYVYSRADKAAKKPNGYTKSLIKENFNADLTMFADEAIKHGYFDGIGTVSMLKDTNDLLKRSGLIDENNQLKYKPERK